MNRNIFKTARMIAIGCVLIGTIVSTGCDSAQNDPQANASPSSTKATVTATPTPAPLDCDKSSNETIRAHIYSALEATKEYILEEWQWNISVADNASGKKEITVIGWSKNYADIKDKIGKLTTNCVIADSKFTETRAQLTAIDNGRYTFPVTCQQGCVPCGDICLCDGTNCKVTEAVHVPPAAKAAVNANSRLTAAPSNSASNTNSAPANSKRGN